MVFMLLCFFAFSAESPTLSLVLSPGDDEQILLTALDFCSRRGWQQAPQIIAMAPGPLLLQRNLRLLPNQVPPKNLSVPSVLIINHSQETELSLAFLAFVRRCLDEGSQVLVCGKSFPEPLLDGSLLKPGQVIQLVGPDQLAGKLDLLFPIPTAAELSLHFVELFRLSLRI